LGLNGRLLPGGETDVHEGRFLHLVRGSKVKKEGLFNSAHPCEQLKADGVECDENAMWPALLSIEASEWAWRGLTLGFNITPGGST